MVPVHCRISRLSTSSIHNSSAFILWARTPLPFYGLSCSVPDAGPSSAVRSAPSTIPPGLQMNQKEPPGGRWIARTARVDRIVLPAQPRLHKPHLLTYVTRLDPPKHWGCGVTDICSSTSSIDPHSALRQLQWYGSQRQWARLVQFHSLLFFARHFLCCFLGH
ncbi:hypothetical protein BD289DRAFT_188076 [Coniella lustricola]|uniref:Uncharacterized protein n=1 Tax=Coniella lustricola TaxID=2025994 RepID=A0A2T2ZSZ3_9PEZI|nr:hypothetical protein BD289DRAFT_188076 [Coniella lustricola]